MSIVVRYAPVPASTVEHYDEVMRRLQESGEMPADGFDYHVAFLSDGQLLVSEVWESQERLEMFGKRIIRSWLMLRLNTRANPKFSRPTTSSGASDSPTSQLATGKTRTRSSQSQTARIAVPRGWPTHRCCARRLVSATEARLAYQAGLGCARRTGRPALTQLGRSPTSRQDRCCRGRAGTAGRCPS